MLAGMDSKLALLMSRDHRRPVRHVDAANPGGPPGATPASRSYLCAARPKREIVLWVEHVSARHRAFEGRKVAGPPLR
jgi:hypothetical protein